jgi:hypothetical protein
MASIPSLLKPKRLMAAWSSVRRKRRGLALPVCGRGVAPPTSRKPKPVRDSGAMASAFLSNPAARPTGLGSDIPASVVSSRGEVTGPDSGSIPVFSAAMASAWARSGSMRRMTERPKRSHMA